MAHPVAGSKRVFSDLENKENTIQPNKRPKQEITQENNASQAISPADLPSDIIANIFCWLTPKEILIFGHTAKRLDYFADLKFDQLRKDKTFLIDWNCCGKRHAPNYFLTQNVVNYILSLGRKLGKNHGVKLKLIEQYKPISDTIEPFKALVDLTRLEKGKEIPEELSLKLRTERITDVILDIYQLAREASQVNKKKANKNIKEDRQQIHDKKTKPKKHIVQDASPVKKKNKNITEGRQQINDKIQEFDKISKPKIYQLMDEGATYFSSFVTNIFWRHFLIHHRRNVQDTYFYRLAGDLSMKANEKGDISGIQKLYDTQVALADSLDIIDDFNLLKLQFLSLQDNAQWQINWSRNAWLNTWELNNLCSNNNSNVYENLSKQKQIWEKLANYNDKYKSDPELSLAIFKYHLQDKNWAEADKLLPKVFTFTQENNDLLTVAARFKANLNQYKEANNYYDKLVSTLEFEEDAVGVPLPLYRGYRFQRGDILVEAIEVKIKLQDGEGVEDRINKLMTDINKIFCFLSPKGVTQLIDILRSLKREEEAEWLLNLEEFVKSHMNNMPLPLPFHQPLGNFDSQCLTPFIQRIPINILFELALCESFERADYFFGIIEQKYALTKWDNYALKKYVLIKNELQQWEEGYRICGQALSKEKSRFDESPFFELQAETFKAHLNNV
jgi:hypothetical protein